MYGKTLSIPDAAMPSWYDLLLGRAAAGGRVAARRQARPRARARDPLPRRRRPRRPPRRTSTACTSRARCPRTCRRCVLARRRRSSTCPQLLGRRSFGDVALGGAAHDRPGRRAARRRAGHRARPARRRARRPRAAGRQAPLPAARRAADGGPHRAAAAADRGRGPDRRPHRRARERAALRRRRRRRGDGVRDRLDGRDHDDGVRARRGRRTCRRRSSGWCRGRGPRAATTPTTRATTTTTRTRTCARRCSARRSRSRSCAGASCSGTWQQVVLIDFDDRPRERVGARPDRVLRLLHSAPLRKSARPSGPFGTAGARYTPLPAPGAHGLPGKRSERGVPSHRKARRSLKTQQHAHLTAGFGRSSVCVQVRSAAGLRPSGGLRNQEVPQYPVEAPGLRSMCTSSPSCGALTALREQFFTESLILAQDERWRRA